MLMIAFIFILSGCGIVQDERSIPLLSREKAQQCAEAIVQPKVIFRVAAARSTFGTGDAPLYLIFTFLNVGTQPFTLCPNRIENQNTIKFIVSKTPSNFPSNTLKWEDIPSAIADYYHDDKEEYVTVAPNECYVLKDSYFAGKDINFKALLDFVGSNEGHDAHRGTYYIKAYFNGKKCGFSAPEQIKSSLLHSRLESNVIEISVQEQKDK